MRHVGFFVSQSHRSNEPLHLHGLSSESLSDKRGLVDHSLPTLALLRTGLDDLEHLLLGNPSNLGQRHAVLGRLVLSPLLDTARQGLGILLTLSVQQVGRQSSLLGSRIVRLLDVSLVVCLEGLFELNLFGMSFSVVQLGLDSVQLLSYGRVLVGFTGGSLSTARWVGAREGVCQLRMDRFRWKRASHRLTLAPRDRAFDHIASCALPYTHSTGWRGENASVL